jgi:hypothetical protein
MAGNTRVVRYVLTGDSSGSVRAMRETATAADHTATALGRTGTRAEVAHAKIDTLGKGFGRLRGSMSGLTGAIGLAGIGLGFRNVVQAGLALQTNQAQLQSALRATGNTSKTTMDQVMAAAEASSRHGGFDVPTQIGGLTRFITETHSASAAIKDNTAVTDVARRLHTDYGSALSIVARAQVGATGRLQQYLGVIQPVTSHVQALKDQVKNQNLEQTRAVQLWKLSHPHMKLLAQQTAQINQQALRNAQLQDKQATANMVNQRILQNLGGATTAYSHTTQGALSDAKNGYEALKAQLGSAFLPTVKSVAGVMGDVAGAMEKHKTLSVGVIAAVSAMTAWFLVYKTAAAAAEVATGTWTAAQKTWAWVTRTSVAQTATATAAADAQMEAANVTAGASFTAQATEVAAAGTAVETQVAERPQPPRLRTPRLRRRT